MIRSIVDCLYLCGVITNHTAIHTGMQHLEQFRRTLCITQVFCNAKTQCLLEFYICYCALYCAPILYYNIINKKFSPFVSSF